MILVKLLSIHPYLSLLLRLEKVHLFSCFVFLETLYLLCMPIPLYSASFLELWSSSLETTTVLLPTNMVIIISLFQMLCLAIFTDFLRDMFRCTKIQLVTLWEIEFRRPNTWPCRDSNENFWHFFLIL